MHWARYLRQVHIEWCPWKPKAIAPAFLGHIGTAQIAEAVPKLQISKKVLPRPASTAAEYVDRIILTYADDSKKALDLGDDLKLRDIMEEIDIDNGRLAAAEQERGRPF